jgi:hypothetical protein
MKDGGSAVQPIVGDEGSLVVRLAPSNAGTRALIGTTTAEQVAAFESNVVEFTAYLFDETGAFLKQGSTDPGESEVAFSGYVENDQIQVVAIANSSVSGVVAPTLAVGTDDLADLTSTLTSMVNLNTQIPSDFTDLTKGLLMTGQYGNGSKGNLDDADAVSPIYTMTKGLNTIEVPVERVVAKIELGDVTFGGTVSVGDLLAFHVKGAGVQKALTTSYLYPGEIITHPTLGTPQYYGAWAGLATDGSQSSVLTGLGDTNDDGLLDLDGILDTVLGAVLNDDGTLLGPTVDGLLETILTALNIATLGQLDIDDIIDGLLDGTLPFADDLLEFLDGVLISKIAPGLNLGELVVTSTNFWYALPNNNGAAAVAQPTLLTILGELDDDEAYFPIAINEAGKGTVTAANDGLYRNTRYIVNLTFNSLNGVPDPDTASLTDNLVVTVTPIEWEGPVNQNSTW